MYNLSNWDNTLFTQQKANDEFIRKLEQIIEVSTDPLSDDEFLKLVEVITLRQLVQTQVQSYSDIDLDTLVRLGRKDEAIWRTYQRSTLIQQVHGLLRIGDTLQETDQLDSDFLEEISKQVHKTLNDSMNGIPYWRLSELYAKIGDFQSAQAIMNNMQDSCNRYNARLSLVEAAAVADHADFALEIANKRFSKSDAPFARSRVFSVQAKKVMTEPNGWISASDFIDKIETIYYKLPALTDFAIKLWENNQKDRSSVVLQEALGLAERSDGQRARDEAYSHIVRAYLAMSDIVSAREILKEIADTSRLINMPEAPIYAVLLGELAYSLEKVGNHEAAHSLYQQLLQIDKDRDAVLMQLAARFVQLNDLNKAREMISYLSTNAKQGKSLSEIANLCCRIGRSKEGEQLFQESRELIEFSGDQRDYLNALQAVASAFSIAGKPNKALSILKIAHKATNQLTEIWEVNWTLGHLVEGFVQAGDLSTAEKIVEESENENNKLHRLCDYVIALVRYEYLDIANNQINSLEQLLKSEKVDMDSLDLERLADAFIATRRYTQAQTYLRQSVQQIYTPGNEWIDQDLTGLACNLLQANDLNSAIEMTKNIKSAYERCRALRLLVKQLAEDNRIDEAEYVLELIKKDSEGSEYQEARAQIILAHALYRLNRGDQAAELLNKVLKKTDKFQHMWHKLRILAHLGSVFALNLNAEGEQDAYHRLDEAIDEYRTRQQADRYRYGIDLTQVQYKYIVSLIDAGYLERASARVKAFPRDGQFDTWYYSACRELSNASAHKGQYAQAFKFFDNGLLPLNLLDTYLSRLASWMSNDTQTPSSTRAEALEKAITLAGWVRPDWQNIVTAIRTN